MEITVGKSQECDYRIDSEVISRVHCKLVFQNNNLFIVDLGSTNGTYVDRQRIPAQSMVPIQPDTEILLSGQVALDWGFVRKLMPGLSSARTKYIPQAEIDQMVRDRAIASRQAAAPYEHRAATQPPLSQPQAGPQPPPPQVIVAQQQGAGLGANDLVYAVHAAKSFTGKAFLTLALYYIGLYVGGLIMNILYISEADTTKKVIGHNPPGYSCLWFLLITHFFIPLAALVGILVFGLSLTESIREIRFW